MRAAAAVAVVVFAACGSTPGPLDSAATRPRSGQADPEPNPAGSSSDGPERDAAGSTDGPERGAAGSRGSVAPPDPRVELAAALEAAGVRDFMLEAGTRDACRGVAGPYRILSAAVTVDDAVSCVAGAAGLACTPFAGRDPVHVERVLCATGAIPSAAAPRWLPPLIAELRRLDPEDLWSLAIVPTPDARPALALFTDDGPHLLVRRTRWQPTTEVLVPQYSRRPTVARIIDTGGLAGGPWVAVVVDLYDGGSEMGEAVTWLVLLDASGATLRERTRMQIGGFLWALAAEARHKIRDPSNLRERPHLEVELEPAFDAAGVLTLTRKRVTLPAKQRAAWEESPCREDDDCPFTRMQAVERSAGRWRFDGQTFVR